MDNLISERAKTALKCEDLMNKNMTICESNKYDKKKNPYGFVSFGTDVNRLRVDIPDQNSNEVRRCDFDDSLGYKKGWGTWKLQVAMANSITKFLESHQPVSPNDLFCVTGATSCIDLLAHCLADPGEVFLIPAPLYGRIYIDFMQRSLVDIFPVNVIAEDGKDTELTMDKIIGAYESAVSANKVVRGIFLINGYNPLRDIYSPQLLMNIMFFCKAKSLHFVVDEVFALTEFSIIENFHSILKFPELPDPDRTHILYGLSEDLEINGLRIGVIHTKSKLLQKCLCQLSYFQTIPTQIMEVAEALLEDLDWMGKITRPQQVRVKENYMFCVNYLQEMGVKVRECSAGVFVWVNLSEFCGSSFEEERKFFDFLKNNFHIYISPGDWFRCAQPGWFRIAITKHDSHLKAGLQRLKDALKAYEKEKK